MVDTGSYVLCLFLESLREVDRMAAKHQCCR